MSKRPSDQNLVVGLGWFDREQWQRLTEVVEDRGALDDTFEQWKRSALDAVRSLERQGQRVEKVHVNVEALVSWCKAKGVPIDGASRAKYVSHVLQQRNGQAGV